MQFIRHTVQRIDALQQQHIWLAFPFAVIKKYGDDDASHYGAVITYYTFLSLFPLLFALTAGLHLLFRSNTHLQTDVLADVRHYFPLLGSELQTNVKSVGRTSLTLLGGIIVAIYGARGGADAVRAALDHMWHIPKHERSGFLPAMAKSLTMIFGGGGLLLAAAALSSYATGLGHSAIFKIISTAISLCIVIASLFLIFRIGISSADVSSKSLALSAVLAGSGLQALQTYGGYLMTHELSRLNTPYGAFSVALALLFWLYLQAQVLLYAIEASVVHARRLWPRRIDESQAARQPSDPKHHRTTIRT